MSYYVIIRGSLGVGKTTVSESLANAIKAEVVSIDQFADENWDGGSLGLFLKANKGAAAEARESLACDTPVVFDGCFYWKTQIEDLDKRLPFPHHVFTLKAPLPVCIARDSGRKIPFGVEAAKQVYRKVARFDYGISIDATRSISSLVREIRSHLLPG